MGEVGSDESWRAFPGFPPLPGAGHSSPRSAKDKNSPSRLPANFPFPAVRKDPVIASRPGQHHRDTSRYRREELKKGVQGFLQVEISPSEEKTQAACISARRPFRADFHDRLRRFGHFVTSSRIQALDLTRWAPVWGCGPFPVRPPSISRPKARSAPFWSRPLPSASNPRADECFSRRIPGAHRLSRVVSGNHEEGI
jgi:hypothetical protein